MRGSGLIVDSPVTSTPRLTLTTPPAAAVRGLDTLRFIVTFIIVQSKGYHARFQDSQHAFHYSTAATPSIAIAAVRYQTGCCDTTDQAMLVLESEVML